MPLTYVEDWPAEAPEFDFELIAQSLSPLLLESTRGALVLGVHGPWGSGKTTLMHAVRRELARRTGDGRGVFVDFNAWKFHEREALWRALILHLLAELRTVADDRTKQQLDELEQSLYRAFVVQEKGPWTVNWRTLVTEVVGIALSVMQLDFAARALRASSSWLGRLFGSKKDGDGIVDQARVQQLAGVLERATVERHVDQVQSIEQFLDKFKDVVQRLRSDDRRVYVLIDDLDRCLPEAALDIFESIKLFLDAPGCVFLVALDRDVIRKGLSLRYGSGGRDDGALLIDPDQYIEKTISISYDLPRLSTADAYGIIDSFKLPVALSDDQRALLVSGLGVNPRRLKRFMNTLSVQLRLAELANAQGRPVPACLLPGGDAADLAHYLKLLLISYRFSGLFGLVFEDDKVLVRLQDVANTHAAAGPADAHARETRKRSLAGESVLVRALDNEEDFWRLMRKRPHFRDDDPMTMELVRWFRHEAGVAG